MCTWTFQTVCAFGLFHAVLYLRALGSEMAGADERVHIASTVRSLMMMRSDDVAAAASAAPSPPRGSGLNAAGPATAAASSRPPPPLASEQRFLDALPEGPPWRVLRPSAACRAAGIIGSSAAPKTRGLNLCYVYYVVNNRAKRC